MTEILAPVDPKISSEGPKSLPPARASVDSERELDLTSPRRDSDSTLLALNGEHRRPKKQRTILP